MFKQKFGVLFVCLSGAALSVSAETAAPLVDPTRPPAAEVPAFSETDEIRQETWRLDSTLVSEFRRIAVINGQRVSEGGAVGTATVAEIGRDEVVLLADGREIVLKESPRPDVKQKKGT